MHLRNEAWSRDESMMRMVLRMVLRRRSGAVLLRFKGSFTNFSFYHAVEPRRRCWHQWNRFVGEVEVLVVHHFVRRRVALEAPDLFEHELWLTVFKEFFVVRLVKVNMVFLNVNWTHRLEIRLDEDAAFPTNGMHWDDVLCPSHDEFLEVEIAHGLVAALFRPVVHCRLAHYVVLMILPDFVKSSNSRPTCVVDRKVNAIVDFVQDRWEVWLGTWQMVL